jgi:hypothetical protein
MERFEIKLPSSQKAELASMAHRLGLSASDIARLSIQNFLQNPRLDPPRQPEELR